MEWIVKEQINEYVIVDENQPHASPVAIGMTKETATLICQAVNSHKRLLEALNEAQLFIGKLKYSETPCTNDLWAKMEQAIAQAEEN